ncbi:MAG: nucleotidyltransferase family protein [Acidobacteriota bacterium]|nr:nucleotidyltransferase family protein [Acidobacteriota bacterium]
MISGILLAAGESKRMQPNFKPLLKWGKRTVIGECVYQLRNSQLADIFVVLGYRESDVRTRLAGTGVQYAVNEDYANGMLSSIKTGLAMIGPNTDAVLIALVDQPMVKSDVINKLIDAYGDGSKGIIIPTYQGNHGHPIIVSYSYFDEMMQLDEATPEGLGAFINAHKNDWLEVPVETSAVIEDIDVPEQYQRLSRQAAPLYEYHNWHP